MKSFYRNFGCLFVGSNIFFASYLPQESTNIISQSTAAYYATFAFTTYNSFGIFFFSPFLYLVTFSIVGIILYKSCKRQSENGSV